MADRPIEARGPDVIAPPPLLYLGPLLVGLALDRVLPLPRLPAGARAAGLALVAGGLGFGGWFLAEMRRARTPVDPYKPPTALVVTGPFRFSRNPAYVGFALTYVGVSLLAGGRWPLLFLPGLLGVVNRGVIAREEVYLQERFGDAYRDYQSQVRRWL